MDEPRLGDLLNDAVPPLASPPDRMASVRRRARRQQRVVVAVAAGAVGAVVATVVIVMGSGSQLANRRLPVGTTPTPSVTSTVVADGVLRTPGCATYPNAGPTTIEGTPVSGNQDLVENLSHQIIPYAEQHFSDVYALPEHTDLGRLRVYRKPSAQFDAWIMREFADDCVEIADARYSAHESQKITNRISDDFGYWRGRGISINAVGGDPITGVFEVLVGKVDLAQARAAIPGHYPDLTIVVKEGGPTTN